MSTRANIIIKDGDEKLIFYRHSDGYPSGTLPMLYTFIEWIMAGKIRDNIQQAAGWLIVLGAIEYQNIPAHETKQVEVGLGNPTEDRFVEGSVKEPKHWKVGAFEPTTCIHYDIAYLYTIDLKTRKIKVQKASWNQVTDRPSYKTLKDPLNVGS